MEDQMNQIREWLDSNIENIERVEGEIIKTTDIGGSKYVKFKNGNTYVLSFQKNCTKVVLDKSSE
jgi:hypothetical protein